MPARGCGRFVPTPVGRILETPTRRRRGRMSRWHTRRIVAARSADRNTVVCVSQDWIAFLTARRAVQDGDPLRCLVVVTSIIVLSCRMDRSRDVDGTGVRG